MPAVHCPLPTAHRLRVGFITPALYWGGAERWMLDFARFSRDEIDWVGCAVVGKMFNDDNMLSLFGGLMPVWGHGLTAVQHVAKEADVLVAWGSYDLQELVRGFLGPVVFVSHGSGRFDRNAARAAHAGATHCVAVAKASLRPFVGLVPSDQVTVIHNGIDPQRCAQTLPRELVRRRLGVAPEEHLVGYLGRMVPEKNPVGVARAVALLPPNFRAVFVGDGYDVANQRARIQRVLGPRAILVDRVEDVGNYLAAFDCFAMASPAEGFSMAMLEAMLRGVPCALSNVGVLPELESLHGRHWEAVSPAHHPRDLAAAILRTAQMPPEALAARVARAKQIVETRYLASHMAARWVEYLRRVAAGLTLDKERSRLTHASH
jgi:glycosyltransferase involved in cell wall biosynthesis